MANINNYGYEKLRSFILSSWKYLEVRTPSGTVLGRFTTSDGLIVTGSSTTAVIEYKLVLSGSDPKFTNKSVGKSVLFDVATGGNAIATENFTGFTFESADDELTIIHKLEVPQVI